MKYGELNLGQMEAIVNKLGGMEGVKQLLSGNLELKVINHIIDCDAVPFLPNGYKEVVEHQKMGNLKFDPSKIDLYLSEKQKNGSIEGNKLREELKGKKVLNANVLDYLLKNPQLIPEEWKGKSIFFWGTIYRSSNGNLYVRYLGWDDSSWSWFRHWLCNDFYANYPSALAS